MIIRNTILEITLFLTNYRVFFKKFSFNYVKDYLWANCAEYLRGTLDLEWLLLDSVYFNKINQERGKINW